MNMPRVPKGRGPLKTTKRCQSCIHYRALNVPGDTAVHPIHLCKLPPDCRPLSVIEQDDDDARHDAERGEYLGTFCGVMRKPGAMCGPLASMWRKRPRYLDVVPVLETLARQAFEKRFQNDSLERSTVLRYGDKAACLHGVLTREVAERYGHAVAKTRRHLVQAIAHGWVIVDGRGGVGGIRWWPTGLAAKLQGEHA